MLSPKQRHVATYGARDKRWTFVSGPVGSGKTHAGEIGFTLWQRNYGGHEFGLITKGRPQLGSLLREFGRHLHVDLTIDSDGVVALPGASGMTNSLICFLGTDKRSEPRIRGFNLTGFFADEIVTYPYSLVAAINARCRVGDPRILGLTNPDGPRHPLKVNYLDQADKMNAEVIYTSVYDNPTVTQAYIDSLHASYSGHMLERMVYGRWAAASGLVYPHYLECVGVPEDVEIVAMDVSIDVGESSVTHALLSGRTRDGKTWIIDECRHHHIEEGVLNDREMVAKIKRAFSGWAKPLEINSWIVDPSAARFRQEMVNQGLRSVGQAENDYREGIDEVNYWINTGALRIWAERVPHLMNELGALVWDEEQSEKGNDVPAATPDHGADALRYLVLTRTIHEIGGRKMWEARRKRRVEIPR